MAFGAFPDSMRVLAAAVTHRTRGSGRIVAGRKVVTTGPGAMLIAPVGYEDSRDAHTDATDR